MGFRVFFISFGFSVLNLTRALVRLEPYGVGLAHSSHRDIYWTEHHRNGGGNSRPISSANSLSQARFLFLQINSSHCKTSKQATDDERVILVWYRFRSSDLESRHTGGIYVSRYRKYTVGFKYLTL